ncbi:hypothetical protein BU16DRAFT_564011 [Lophium mytilinum]|uniref:Uncharacterized protein n=1 Tax=Lophium mytilinum TaxID=390894 RepID=A0A6A6QLU8_9PEZI|nr:hypothetical protein BU16DRAFT_564011 [Lophium mytilinum]
MATNTSHSLKPVSKDRHAETPPTPQTTKLAEAQQRQTPPETPSSASSSLSPPPSILHSPPTDLRLASPRSTIRPTAPSASSSLSPPPIIYSPPKEPSLSTMQPSTPSLTADPQHSPDPQQSSEPQQPPEPQLSPEPQQSPDPQQPPEPQQPPDLDPVADRALYEERRENLRKTIQRQEQLRAKRKQEDDSIAMAAGRLRKTRASKELRELREAVLKGVGVRVGDEEEEGLGDAGFEGEQADGQVDTPDVDLFEEESCWLDAGERRFLDVRELYRRGAHGSPPAESSARPDMRSSWGRPGVEPRPLREAQNEIAEQGQEPRRSLVVKLKVPRGKLARLS